MAHGILGGVFDGPIALKTLQNQDFTSTVLGFPSDPYTQNIMVNRSKYCMLSNMYNSSATYYNHRRTMVDYDGNLLELTNSAAIPGISYQLYPPLKGVQPSDTDFFVTFPYESKPDIVKYNPTTSTWQIVFNMPDSVHSAQGSAIVTVKDKVYYFGSLSSSGSFSAIVVENIDLNAGTMTRLASHPNPGNSSTYGNVVGIGTDHEDIIYMASVSTNSGPSALQLWKYVISTNTISLVDTFPSNSDIYFMSGGALVPSNDGSILFLPKKLNLAAADMKPVKMYPGQSRFDILTNTGLVWPNGSMFNTIPGGCITYSVGDRYPLFIQLKQD